jgi:hypothetical protein
MGDGEAAARAAARVEAVRDSLEGRYRLAAAFYRGPRASSGCRRYAGADLSFMRWAIERGVFNRPDGRPPGSRWWRALNDQLLGDKVEAQLLAEGSDGTASARSVELWLEFMRYPSASSWYRAHNASIVAGYLGQRGLADEELAAERFMMNVALVRVLFAHALAAAPRLALGPFAPLGRWLGDPRQRSVSLFLDLRDQFPPDYPLEGWSVDELNEAEGTLARTLDKGIILPRLTELYGFAAESLGEPRLRTLVTRGAPCYAWPPEDRAPWLVGADRPLVRAIAIATGRRPPDYTRPDP